MGLILDTTVLIVAERSDRSVSTLVSDLEVLYGDVEIALSAITVVELTHGVYRAKTEEQRYLRQRFADQVFRVFPIHSVSTAIAQLAGRIEGQAAARGIIIPFQDLVIGATALSIDGAVLTRNVRHFQLIPDLLVHTLP